jgi:hypothetical protein
MLKLTTPQWIIGGLGLAAFMLVAISTLPH